MSGPEHHTQHKKHIEVTQQQISIVAASFLLTAFVAYLLGQGVGQTACQSIEWQESNPSSDGTSAQLQNLIHKKDDLQTKQNQHMQNKTVHETDCGEHNETAPQKVYYAVLARSGSLEDACVYIERLRKHSIKACISGQASHSCAGVERRLYQIVSDDYTDLSEVEKLIEKVKKMQCKGWTIKEKIK